MSASPALAPEHDAVPVTLGSPLIIKAITVHQPYAGLIGLGMKRFETRSWSTSYRGPIAIHSGLSRDSLQWVATDRRDDEAKFIRDLLKFDDATWEATHIMGAIIAVGLLTACYRSEVMRDRIGERERLMGNYKDKRFGLEITSVVMLPQPVEVGGQLGLWDWTPSPDIALLIPEWPVPDAA